MNIFFLPARVAAAAFLAAALLAVAPPVLARNGNCFFQAQGLNLSFGALDPSNAINVTASTQAGTANADKAGDCKSLTMTISGDNGLNFNGTRRLRNGSDYIAYTLALPITLPAPGNNLYSTFSFTGTILGSAYRNASAGSYSDTVILTVSP